MDTLKFGYYLTNERRTQLSLDIPQRILDTLDYKYEKVVDKAKKVGGPMIKSEDVDGGRCYIFNPKAIGRATGNKKYSSLVTASELILAAQYIASSQKQLHDYNLFDPNLRLKPSVSRQMGVLPLVATLAWQGAAGKSADQLIVGAHRQMTEVHKDLLDPKRSADNSTHLIVAQAHPLRGVLLGVGNPREDIHSEPYSLGQPALVLRGHTTNLEHSFVLMTGAIVLADTVKLVEE